MKKINRKKQIRNVTILIISLVILVGGIGGFVSFNNGLSAVSENKSPVIFEVVSGDTLDSIVDRLEKNGIIKSASKAKILAKMKGYTNFAIGRYQLNKNMDTKEILSYLSNQKNIMHNQVLITFKEGIWSRDIAKELSKHLNVSEQQMINLWNDDKFLKKCIKKYDFLTDDILNSQYKIKLEGYLFPETYYFEKNATPEQITYTFLDHFDAEYKKLKPYIEKSKYSIHEIVTLASVVQYESATKKDMKMIAGVFYNRLKKHQKLESSATVCYAIYDYNSWEECETQTDIQSPYNTYLKDGLPVGPILNPGRDALEATVNPAKHDYLFFVADVKKDGKVYYTKTYEEHLKMVEKLNLNL